MEERRRNNRIKLTSTLLIKRLDRDTQEPVEIEILDVSKSGVGFFLFQAVGDWGCL